MQQSFDQFNASLLYCNKCGRAMPVRQRLLLVLPDGELYDYTCQGCNSSVGSKTEKAGVNPAGRASGSKVGGF
jgi:hypothetical protein